MKNYFILLVYAFLFFSCDSTESEEITSDISYHSKTSHDIPPVNSSNDYDIVGQVHHDVLYSYYADSFLPMSSDSIVKRVNLKASSHPYFDNFLLADYDLIPESRIAYLVSNSSTAFESIVTDLPLSLQAKTDFRLFVSTVLSKVNNGVDYLDIHNYVVSYESSVVASTTYTASEKEYLLIVTSIIRHSVYAKEKRPKKNTDPDWDWLTANITGAVEGAQYGKSHAILTALKAGIIENR